MPYPWRPLFNRALKQGAENITQDPDPSLAPRNRLACHYRFLTCPSPLLGQLASDACSEVRLRSNPRKSEKVTEATEPIKFSLYDRKPSDSEHLKEIRIDLNALMALLDDTRTVILPVISDVSQARPMGVAVTYTVAARHPQLGRENVVVFPEEIGNWMSRITNTKAIKRRLLKGAVVTVHEKKP